MSNSQNHTSEAPGFALARALDSLDRALAAGLIDEASWQLELQRAWAAAALAKPRPIVSKALPLPTQKSLRLVA